MKTTAPTFEQVAFAAGSDEGEIIEWPPSATDGPIEISLGILASTQFHRKIEQQTAPRRPILEVDHEFDQIDERSANQRRQRFEYALNKVSGPANGLFWVGVIGLVLAPIAAFSSILKLSSFVEETGIYLTTSAIHFGVSILVVLASQKMKHLQNIGFARIAAVLAMIPITSPCCFLGLPIGIQALNALNDIIVRDAIQDVKHYGLHGIV